jgi:cytochrome c biogenesis protein CcmG, thiol:disulfide interchange protein DsbE
MKSALLVASLFLLTGCGTDTSALPGDGLVVDCSSIQTVATSNESVDLDCLDGTSTIDLGQIKGPALVNVWGSWCGPCKDEMPLFVEFYEKHRESVALIGISVEESDIKDAREFVRQYGMTWPNLYDADGRTRVTLGMGVPITLFIDAKGEIAYRKIGVVTTIEELEKETEKYLGVKL